MRQIAAHPHMEPTAGNGIIVFKSGESLMFTGIVEAVGEIKQIRSLEGGHKLEYRARHAGSVRCENRG